jgi:hypothetical protein
LLHEREQASDETEQLRIVDRFGLAGWIATVVVETVSVFDQVAKLINVMLVQDFIVQPDAWRTGIPKGIKFSPN